MHDMINSPKHYTFGTVECIDAIHSSMSNEQFNAFLKGQVFKYLWRLGMKDDTKQDALKAKFYMDRLVKELTNDGK